MHKAGQVAVVLNPESFWTVAREAALATESANQIKATRGLGDLPLMVLTLMASSSTWMELQKELAGLSTQGKLIAVEGTGHYSQLGYPHISN